MSDKLKFEEKMIKQTLFRKTWILKVVAILITYHLSLTATEAQTFTQRIQQNNVGNSRVVIHQDAAIDELVNGRLTVPETPRTNGGQNNRREADRQQQRTDNTGENQREEALRTDSVAQVPQRTHKVMGYRIQVFVGGKTRADKRKAESTASTIRSLFPEHKVYVHFYSPRWICRMGNFRTLDEAREMLNKVVSMGYDTATLVRGQVTVPY